MEVLEQEAKNCRITTARTNLPFIIFSTFLVGQHQLFTLLVLERQGKRKQEFS